MIPGFINTKVAVSIFESHNWDFENPTNKDTKNFKDFACLNCRCILYNHYSVGGNYHVIYDSKKNKSLGHLTCNEIIIEEVME